MVRKVQLYVLNGDCVNHPTPHHHHLVCNRKATAVYGECNVSRFGLAIRRKADIRTTSVRFPALALEQL